MLITKIFDKFLMLSNIWAAKMSAITFLKRTHYILHENNKVSKASAAWSVPSLKCMIALMNRCNYTGITFTCCNLVLKLVKHGESKILHKIKISCIGLKPFLFSCNLSLQIYIHAYKFRTVCEWRKISYSFEVQNV